MALGGRIAYVKAMTQPHRPVGPGDHVFLVDGSSFVFRAYYQSIRQDQKYNYRTDRLPTGAIRLFATKVLQFIRDGAGGHKPTHLAMIFDKTENSFRRDIYPQYKAHRKDPPDELVPQFPLMRATVSAFGMVPIEQSRYEADDIIATYARQARASRRRRAHRLGRQGPHAARRAGRVDVRPGFGPGRRRRLSRGAALRRRRGQGIFRRRPRQGGRRPGARRQIRPTMCRGRPVSGSRPPLSSSPNMATSRRCSRARARSNSRSAAKR